MRSICISNLTQTCAIISRQLDEVRSGVHTEKPYRLLRLVRVHTKKKNISILFFIHMQLFLSSAIYFNTRRSYVMIRCCITERHAN